MSELRAGSVYRVAHSRKGRFTMRVESFDDAWASGFVVEGVAEALLEHNRKFEQYPVSVRRDLCTFEEVPTDG